MKRVIVLLNIIAFSSLFAHAVPIKSKDLIGTWKETARIKSGSKVDYSDTLFFEFLENNICMWAKQKGLALRAAYILTDKTLEIGPGYYQILKQTDEKISLSSDDGTVIEISRYTKLQEQTDNNAASSSARALRSEKGIIPQNISSLLGIWKCYKRTSDNPIQDETKYRMLRLVEIVEQAELITGKVYGYKDMDNQPSWVIQKYENGILHCGGKDERAFKVIHCQQGRELVVENEGIVYYMNIQ